MRAFLRLCCALLALSAFLIPGAAGAQEEVAPAPATTMASGVLIDLETKKVLWAKNPDSPRSPASLTKVLTALTVLDSGIPLESTTTISHAARTVKGGRMYAEQGWTFTIQDLLWGLLLQSGNDAAIALAEKVSPDGSVSGFMKLANAKARELGATHSNFLNPHGLDEPGHRTTAHDLAVITAAAMNNPIFRQIVASKTHVVPWDGGSPHLLINHNKMLWRAPGTIGVKTGFTDEAGNCLITAMLRNNTTMVAVVLGTPAHYAETTALLDWGFANLDALRVNATSNVRPPVQVVDAPVVETRVARFDVAADSSASLWALIPGLIAAFSATAALLWRQRVVYAK